MKSKEFMYKPEIMALGKKIVGVRNKAMYYLLYFTEPDAFNKGACGWNYDIYHTIGRLTITTGYSYIGQKVDLDLIKPYEDMAKKVMRSNKPYEDKKAFISINQNKELINGYFRHSN